MSSPIKQATYITQPLLNSIPDHLLPRFDPTFVEYHNKYSVGRFHTHQIPIEDYRANPSQYIISYGRAIGPEVHRISDLKCPVKDGAVTIRAYEPAEVDPGTKRPAYINYHGGGWVFGNLDTDAEFCKRICKETGAVVFDVDYRLAPEFKFPTPVDDSWTAFQWIRIEKAQEFNLDLKRLAIGGLSAGGHISAVIAHKCRDMGIPLALQLLIVPVTDLHYYTPTGELRDDYPYESPREMRDTVMLPFARMRYFHRHFLGNPRPKEYDDESKEVYWHVSPIRHTNFTDLAPALIMTAEMDTVRDEGEAYGKKMDEAGSKAEVIRVKGAPHPFLHLDGILDIARTSIQKIVGTLNVTFESV